MQRFLRTERGLIENLQLIVQLKLMIYKCDCICRKGVKKINYARDLLEGPWDDVGEFLAILPNKLASLKAMLV